MPKLMYKTKDVYKGIATYNDVEYTENELHKMSEEFYELEKSLSKKYKDYDSEYSYELGKILSDKLSEYKIIQSERFKFWKMLREYVNKRDKRKTITDLRDAYEYCYLLSKLPKALAIKYSRSKWDHLFDVVTARKDARIYNWLTDITDDNFVNNSDTFQNFCKGLKVYFQNVDTGVYNDDEINKIYDEVLNKTLILMKFIKDNKVKLNSKDRDQYFISTKNVESKNIDELNNILKVLS